MLTNRAMRNRTTGRSLQEETRFLRWEQGRESKAQKMLIFNVFEIYIKKCQDGRRNEARKERSEQKNGETEGERVRGRKQD